MHRPLLIGLALSLSACSSCKKKPEPAPAPAASSSTVASTSVTAPSTKLLVEKFIDAHPLADGLEIAAIARDRTVVVAALDQSLSVRNVTVLARDVEAVEGTDVAMAPGGLVVVTAKIGGARGTYLLRSNAAPRTIGVERCELRDGFAWLERDAEHARIKAARTGGDSESPAIAVPQDREVHLACGPTTVALSTRDGENLSMTGWKVDGGAPGPLAEIEKEGALDDELRERLTLVRESGDAVLVRVGEKSVSIREGGEWQKLVTEKGKPFALADDVDVIEGAVAPAAKGKVFVLASEPAQGSCSDGDPPRRIVLHTIDGTVVSTRPVIELPCGVEAIAAHLTAEATRARMWWTEPVDAKTCNQKGLPIAAVVTASSDGPAKRLAVLAEGVAQVDASRFVAVVRPGGCVPYEQAGSGALQLVK